MIFSAPAVAHPVSLAHQLTPSIVVAAYQNVDSNCIKPDLSSKLTLLCMFMHSGWFSTLGVASSLSVCCHAAAMMLTRASFCNLQKYFLFRDQPALDEFD